MGSRTPARRVKDVSGVWPDRWGVPVQATGPEGVLLLDVAVESLVSLSGSPVAEAAAVVAADDQVVLGSVLQAYLALYGMSTAGLAAANELLEGFDHAGPQLGERERLHVQAARSWADGQWEEATRILDRALSHNPRDLLALKVAQDLHFFLGNRRELRDVASRVLPAWPQDSPGWGFVWGMYAFGLEENAEYRGAETCARKALADNPRDVWAVHALTHVFEMEGRTEEGIEFLSASAPDWEGSYFAVHNWWHRGLFHLELGQDHQAQDLYDGPIRASRSSEWLDSGGRGIPPVEALARRGAGRRKSRSTGVGSRSAGRPTGVHLRRLARRHGLRTGRPARTVCGGHRGQSP